MRVATKMHMENWMREVQNTAYKMQQDQIKASSGKSMLELSDNPSRLNWIEALKEQINKLDQYSMAINDGMFWMKTSEEAQGFVANALSYAKEIALIGINATTSQENLSLYEQETEAIIKQMIDLGNTQYADKYIFAGENIQTKPFAFNASGTGVDYYGDTGSVKRQVQGENLMVINVNGKEAFIDSGVFDALFALKDAFHSGDRQAISATLSEIEDAFNNSLYQRARTGNNINLSERIKEQHETQKFYLDGILGDQQEADLAETISNLKIEETAYEVGLAVGSRILQISLVDYLR